MEQQNGKKVFESWLRSLPLKGLDQIETIPSIVLCRPPYISGPPVDSRQFGAAWEVRFGMQIGFRFPGHEYQGWYVCTHSAARQIWEYCNEHARGDFDYVGTQRQLYLIGVEIIRKTNRTPESFPVLVQFTQTGRVKPVLLQVSNVLIAGEPVMRPVWPAAWELTDDRSFRIVVGQPGTISFQRAALLAQSGLEWNRQSAPIYAEWIFGGLHGDNVLGLADGFLSNRKCCPLKGPFVRKLVRQACGKPVSS